MIDQIFEAKLDWIINFCRIIHCYYICGYLINKFNIYKMEMKTKQNKTKWTIVLNIFNWNEYGSISQLLFCCLCGFCFHNTGVCVFVCVCTVYRKIFQSIRLICRYISLLIQKKKKKFRFVCGGLCCLGGFIYLKFIIVPLCVCVFIRWWWWWFVFGS